VLTTPVALTLGFGAGLALAVALILLLRTRDRGAVPRPAAASRPPARVTPALTTMPGPAPADHHPAEREVAAAWMQFVRREVAETVGAINSRLTVVKALIGSVPRDGLGLAQRDALDRACVELDRAVGATATLHGQVSSTAPTPARPSVTKVRPHVVRTGVILVVDPDDVIRDVIGEVFRSAGHRVLPARNGVEAFTVLQQEPVDCIISETRVSRLSGEGLYSQVEQRLPHLARRFVFIAGDTQEPEAREFLERTGCALIPKPFDVELLVEAVDEILEAAADGTPFPAAARPRPDVPEVIV
jgi:CheY-like chemotaxis protein